MLPRAPVAAAGGPATVTASWAALGVEASLPVLDGTRIAEGAPLLRAPTEGEDIVADYGSLG